MPALAPVTSAHFPDQASPTDDLRIDKISLLKFQGITKWMTPISPGAIKYPSSARFRA